MAIDDGWKSTATARAATLGATAYTLDPEYVVKLFVGDGFTYSLWHGTNNIIDHAVVTTNGVNAGEIGISVWQNDTDFNGQFRQSAGCLQLGLPVLRRSWLFPNCRSETP